MFNKYILRPLKTLNQQEILFLIIPVLLIYIALYYLGQLVEPAFYDIMTKVYVQNTAKVKAVPDQRIIMVVIDDASLDKVGRWPWPRSKYIELFEFLQNTAKCKVIAFDSVIKGKDLNSNKSDNYFFSNLAKLPDLILGVEFKPGIENKTPDKSIEKFALTNVIDYRTSKLAHYELNNYFLPKMANNIKSIGSVLTNPENDQKIRTISHLIFYNGKYYPSISLMSVLAYYNQHNPKISIYEDKIILHLPNLQLNIPIDKYKISNNNNYYYRTWIKWYTPHKNKFYSHKFISAYKIFEYIDDLKTNKKNDLNINILKDKIIIIGAEATGIRDIKPSPIFPYHLGVDIQATNINNILDQDFMYKIPWYINIIILILLVLLTLLVTIIIRDFRSAIIICLILAMTYFCLVMYLLYPKNLILDTITPLIFIFTTLLLTYTYSYFIERRKKSELEKTMSKFVSIEVMDEILKNPNNVTLGGERAEISILFCDIRGFTPLSEKLSPEEISSILIEYFNIMEPIVKKHKGIVDKFIGDGIMAIFGAPLRYHDHALKAVEAAIDMQIAINDLRNKWEIQNKEGFEIGIGINTGTTFVGRLGSVERLNYTAIGDAVNIASRLEELNKTLHTNIIISEYTYEKVKNFVEVKSLGKKSLKGRTESIMIYELKGIRKLNDLVIDLKYKI